MIDMIVTILVLFRSETTGAMEMYREIGTLLGVADSHNGQ